MWVPISKFILKFRIAIFIVLVLATAFMGYKAKDVKLQYGFAGMLPADDPTAITFNEFRKTFGSEATAFVMAIEENPLENYQLFNDWYELSEELKTIDGVDTVISVANIMNLKKDVENKRFTLEKIVHGKMKNQAELDSVRQIIESLEFYKGILYNDTTGTMLMVVEFDSALYNSPLRGKLLDHVTEKVNVFKAEQNLGIHFSGFPYIRTVITEMVKFELKEFLILSLIVTIIILLIFFRHHNPVMVSMLVVSMGVVWCLGAMSLLDYQITILTSIIPSLIIVIGIPNCIFLINKFHSEYKSHGNKERALSNTIQKIGKATFMTNATTSAGFITFIFTESKVLVEFGIVASLSILFLFLISLIVIPVLFSFIKPPQEKHTKHLESIFMTRVVSTIIYIVERKRNVVYITTAVLLAIAFFGISKIKTTGNIVDDFPSYHEVTADLHFFEKNFGGVLPFEIAIDAQKPGQIIKEHNLRKIEKLERMLENDPNFSKPISLVDGLKFIKQSYYGGNPDKYSLINNQEKVFFKPYLENETGNSKFTRNFIDKDNQIARINVQVKDLGTAQMDSIARAVKAEADSIFNPEKYKVTITGTSVVYQSGARYLVINLFQSLVLAIFIIAGIMALLFSSFRMILISIGTNMIPLLLTGGIMGYFDIAIKPSTILVFSIAFGIAIDDTIHYLAKYRQELLHNAENIGVSVRKALLETGVSMIYTSIILFFGFSVFDASEFGGTRAMGILVSISLLTAMLANLILLPSFLLTLERSLVTKSFKEPYFHLLDEEEDIDLDQLVILSDEELQKLRDRHNES